MVHSLVEVVVVAEVVLLPTVSSSSESSESPAPRSEGFALCDQARMDVLRSATLTSLVCVGVGVDDRGASSGGAGESKQGLLELLAFFFFFFLFLTFDGLTFDGLTLVLVLASLSSSSRFIFSHTESIDSSPDMVTVCCCCCFCFWENQDATFENIASRMLFLKVSFELILNFKSTLQSHQFHQTLWHVCIQGVPTQKAHGAQLAGKNQYILNL